MTDPKTDTGKQFFSLRQNAERVSESLPALQAIAEKAVAGILHGDHAQSKPGTGEKFWQYRDYVPGDRPQDIDWRQTAKTDHVFIRQKEWQTTQSAIFWCSQHPSMQFVSSKKLPPKIEAARVLTLALGLLMTRAGEQIGAFGSRKTGRSASAVQDVGIKITEDIHSTASLPDAKLYDLPRHAFFVQTGDFLDPLEDIERCFKQFSGQSAGGFVIQILDPAEMDLPYDGRVLFQNSPENARQQIDNVASVRAAYQARIQDHIELLRQLCKEQHWHYILHRTDTAYSQTLADIWVTMSHEHLLSPGRSGKKGGR